MVVMWQFASTFYFRLDANMAHYCGPQHSTTILFYLPPNAQLTAAQPTSAQLNSSVYDAKVSTRAKLHILKSIGSKTAMKPERYKRYIKDPSTDTPFIFDIGQHTLKYGRREFCLVTGFRFGKSCLDHLSKGRSGFRDRVFPGVARVKGTKLNKLLDDDVVHVCLLLALDFVFMGFELRHVISKEVLNLVDDFSAWDNFPWGQHMWEEFHKRGFVFPLKIWLLEAFPNSKTLWVKEQNVIPRRVAWSDGTPFLKCDYHRLFHVRTRLSTLTPSSDEMNKPWWKSSLEYFHNVSNAKVSREVHVRTDVHHYVDEGLSVQDLVKKIGDMQREFQSPITAVEQYVNQHKTSSTANDSPVDNVFSDTRDFDHDSLSRFTENLVNRAALMNKITDMRTDFQRRITSIEQYLKISTSSNVEKTSFESDVDTKNVDNHSMDFDHDPKDLTRRYTPS
ncbi:phospholipase-like protein [Tanacetum coccineum]